MTHRVQSYAPVIPPDARHPEVQALRNYSHNQFRLISLALASQSTLQLEVQNTAPDKPRNGMIVYADGTNWDPGSGEGFYGYSAGTWIKF